MSFPDSDSELSDLGQTGVGLSDPSIAKGRRAMLDLVNRLQNTGVQLDIDLPRIAVIGSQSAGKSSLIESISGVSLPRASGTCTRCPTECRLSRSNTPWKCTVELRFITDKNGTPLGHARTEPFGDPVSDKADVEERIRRAQRAILNPSKSAQSFLEDAGNDDANSQDAYGHGAMQDEMSFSTNFISLSISGPDLADLSFVDLPGLIASVSRGGTDRDIKMVESLVESYISKPSCVILLTVACETDFENQGAHHLAKIHDPEGKRTVGVLTKPDRIPSGEEENWLPLIRNELEPLENNWYCVKQPSSAELKEGVTWNQARDRENDFFTLTAPWSALDSMYHKYLRTPNLVERLSAILSDLISKRLPEIQIELEKSMQLTFQSLQQLPRPPAVDPVAEVAAMLSAFVQDLNQMVDGVPRVDGLIQRIRPAQQEFRRAIQETVPNFCPLEGSTRRANVAEEALIKPGPADEECGAGETIYVDEVANRANDARARELPGHHPFFVQVSFIKEFTAKWDAPAHLLCRSTSAILGAQIKTLISQHFSAFGQGGLENRIMILLQQHLKKRTDAAHELVSTLIKLEMPAPMTLNEHYLADYRQKYLARYRAAREKASNNTFATQIENHQPPSPSALASPSTIDSILGHFASIGLSGLKAEDFAKLLPTDKMGPALEIMADVRAYFQVAYKRVTDNIPLAIDYELVRGVGRDLLPLLYNNLGVGGKEGDRICRELVQESPSVANKREELTKKMERLETASQELVRIEM
ncbi:P-loop containing nucleoside triphosphate hydrolase protein [Mycena amicta]|nr:P-loop containing nucleoside triphosphate hydrolase protein [Mycena amicta]